MATDLSGGCACGAVRYQSAAEPVMALHCRCRHCQQASGTHGGSYLMLPRSAVDLQGEVRFYKREAYSGNTIGRGFCPTCGSPVTARTTGFPDMIGIAAASLDEPDRFQPQAVMFQASALSWAINDPALPVFERAPPPEG